MGVVMVFVGKGAGSSDRGRSFFVRGFVRFCGVCI